MQHPLEIKFREKRLCKISWAEVYKSLSMCKSATLELKLAKVSEKKQGYITQSSLGSILRITLLSFFKFSPVRLFFLQTPLIVNLFNESTESLKGSGNPTKLSNKCNFFRPNILPRFLLQSLMLCARTALVLPVCVLNSNISPSIKLENAGLHCLKLITHYQYHLNRFS